MAEQWRKLAYWCAALALAGAIAVASDSYALTSRAHRRHRRRSVHHSAHHIARAAALYHAALLEDADSGEVLYSQNSTLRWPPASMAKMMLLLVAEDQIRTGRVSLNDPVRISERAALTQGSHLGLHEGEVYPLAELMK